ncbi:unnamed protein product [Dibothriocephalus latus]|uniref:Uncharacterized protein n=1 Tax=Dibothriocephalus latus TaxID=60516 RepID=A0A3P7LFS1_DIBLA|nr:unnamed protein product [Dibothriocephalus latus]
MEVGNISYREMRSLIKADWTEFCLFKPIINLKTIGLITQALAVLHLFAFGRRPAAHPVPTNGPVEPINVPKGSTTRSSEAAQAKAHHWGDYRARLEIAVAEVLEKAEHLQTLQNMQRQKDLDHPPGAPTATDLQPSSLKATQATKQAIANNAVGEFRKLKQQSMRKDRQNVSMDVLDSYDCLSDSSTAAILRADRELNIAVRRVLCPALELLIEHGLRAQSGSSTLGANLTSDDAGILAKWGLGCFSRRPAHAPHDYAQDSSPDEDEDEVLSDGYEDQGKRKRHVQRPRKKSSVTAWSIFLKYYVMKVRCSCPNIYPSPSFTSVVVLARCSQIRKKVCFRTTGSITEIRFFSWSQVQVWTFYYLLLPMVYASH